MTESITPRSKQTPEIRFQPSMLSVPSSASTVAPEDQAPMSAQQAPKGASRRKLWFFAALSAVIGVASASALRGPAALSPQVHSGSPGYKHSSSGQELHWQKPSVTVYLDGSLDKLGPGAREAIMQAFGQWAGSDSRLPGLRFDSGGTSTEPKQDGKSTVSFGRITTPGHEKDIAITVSYSNDKTGEIIEADVILNTLYPMGVLTAKPKAPTPPGNDTGDDHDWSGNHNGHHDHDDYDGGGESMDCRNRYDAQNVATHEAGHFFGLGEDPIERQATMFQTIDQCETHKRELAVTDIGAVTVLYAKHLDAEESQTTARGCSMGGAPLSGGAWVSGAIFGLALLRRRRAR
ncbi:MAG TPA: matrixin family metalloprotease [Polyangiaceae bacterium]|nr:matrixin family metalloprotease [Polyangiaceae bacterium]